ncbi:MAG: ATP phosphoribosyltransferase regulatory subunit, partial [Rhodomicrobium sp.]
MSVESQLDFKVLEAQAAGLMGVFAARGYERIAPLIVQPAGFLLDRLGETIRARTYVFTDDSGEELCLRPDLTLPACRVLLERANVPLPAKYCYNGAIFRIPDAPGRAREIRQAGIEYFGSKYLDADIEVIALTLDAVRKAGLQHFEIKLGHIGAFRGLLDALAMPPRWRERLFHAFWRPKELFEAQLNKLSAGHGPIGGGPAGLLRNEESLLRYLDEKAIPFIGRREPSEIAQRLREKAADAAEPPLPESCAALIREYLQLDGR